MNSEQPQIKEATRAALSEVASLAFRIWPDAYRNILSQAQIQYMLRNMYDLEVLSQQFDAGHKFLFIANRGTNCGFAAFELRGHASARLHKLYVLPSEHRRGFGNLLLQAVERSAAQNGVRSMTLNVNRYNPAIAFYRKCGYEIVEMIDIAIGNGYLMEDYVMKKQIFNEDSTNQTSDAVK